MTDFREKLVILATTELDEMKGYSFNLSDTDQNIGSPNDCVEVENPANKGPRYGQNGETEIVDVIPTQPEFTQPMSAKPEDESSFLFEMLKMPMNKEDTIESLCDWILSIEDTGTLGKVWMRSWNPYKISLTVGDLKTLLTKGQPMIKDDFNIGVCICAYSEYKGLRYKKLYVQKHYMDLRFSLHHVTLIEVTNTVQNIRLAS